MSLPAFPELPDNYDFNSSICQILTSIAMEEIGLSHIINAEGEKIQYILGTLPGKTPNATVAQIIEVNESVKETLQQVAFNQMFLSAKMSSALKAYFDNIKNGGGGGKPNPEPQIKVDIHKDYVEITVGDKYTPSYDITPPEYQNQGVWTSSDPSVATVDSNGLVTAVKPGTAVITLTVEGVSDSITVKVIEKDTEPTKPDIAGMKDGDVIEIDGKDWIKVSSYTDDDGKNYALMMLKDVIGPWQYHSDGSKTTVEYKESEIMHKIDTWYEVLKAPTLKAMAAQADIGTGNAPTWPENGTGIYAHLPRKNVTEKLPADLRYIGENYWLATPAEDSGAWVYQEIVTANGGYGKKLNTQSVYARPILWVGTDK